MIDGVHSWHFDETLVASLHESRHAQSAAATTGDAASLSTLFVFSPATEPGEYFTFGRAEVYTLE